MKREPREIAVIAEMAVFLFAAMLTVAPVAAQQVTGTLGEPSATTTINEKQIPAPPPPFGGSNVGSLRDFERFLRACALRSANLLNKADLARDVGIAPSTANQWLSMLEASGQAVMLEPWFSNRTKSIVKSPNFGHRPALRSSEHSLRGGSSAIARGGSSMGDIYLCPASRPRTPRRSVEQLVLLARPNPRSRFRRGRRRTPGTV